MKVIVPASTSNLGPGFDTLGLAVNRYLTIEGGPAEEFSISVTGEGAGNIPVDRRNLVAQALEKILGDRPKVKIRLANDIPACGGFGASGAAIAGGLLLGNAFSGRKLDMEEIYGLAVEMEGHPDNVSAALFGGLVVNARSAGGKYSYLRIPVENRLKLVAVLPSSRIETEEARKLLPKEVSLAQAVSNVQHSSLLVGALATGNYRAISDALRDELHEKHRKKLIPHFDIFAAAAIESGALGFTVSGAGSSCIAFCLEEFAGVHRAFEDLVEQLGLTWRTAVLEPVNKGAEVWVN